MVEQADPLLLSFVMKYLVVCGTGYTDYVTPFHHLQQGPDHMTLQTLQYYVQYIEMNNEAGVQCVLKIPGLNDLGLGVFCNSSRLKHAVEWQHSLLVHGHLVFLLPVILGISAEELLSFHHNKPVRTCHTLARPDLHFLWPGKLVIVIEFDENNHTNRPAKSEMQHLQVIKAWASNMWSCS
jgi:hypothetical protein